MFDLKVVLSGLSPAEMGFIVARINSDEWCGDFEYKSVNKKARLGKPASCEIIFEEMIPEEAEALMQRLGEIESDLMDADLG